MSGSDDPNENDEEARVVRFPQSRVRLPGSGEPGKELGTSPLAASLGAPGENATRPC
jgi:hypothetical protein